MEVGLGMLYRRCHAPLAALCTEAIVPSATDVPQEGVVCAARDFGIAQSDQTRGLQQHRVSFQCVLCCVCGSLAVCVSWWRVCAPLLLPAASCDEAPPMGCGLAHQALCRAGVFLSRSQRHIAVVIYRHAVCQISGRGQVAMAIGTPIRSFSWCTLPAGTQRCVCAAQPSGASRHGDRHTHPEL
jgi:hypothetical protein